ncbi:MAG TPA: methionine--tRNA ligase [Candidatus Paceibacterota bacterium]
MSSKGPLYITTTLPYVNADPHIGFALEIVQADIIARHNSLLGRDVYFNTGTDEHGQKIYDRALKEGKDPQAYVDEYATKFKSLKERLNLYADIHFIRTTDQHHIEAAQELWRRCLKNGDIYKKKYRGLYCVGDEAFMRESDLVDGKCPNHPSMKITEIEEENYFFSLSKYQEKLIKYLSKKEVIIPEWRRKEAIDFVQRGLEDFSISRVKEKMPWGLPVPNDDSQVMYVWFDALTNYISTLGWPDDKEGNFDRFWNKGFSIQMAGKDQVRFQSIMWQAMLMSADVKTTDEIFYHGFITSGGQKMSKSLGNVIDPIAIAEEYGVDALRYYLARHIHPVEDSDFTMERFKEAYNADLANGLGNLVSRVFKMAASYDVELPQFDNNYSNNEFLDNFEIQKAADAIWSWIRELDGFIEAEQPFKKIKIDSDGAKRDIQQLLKGVYNVSVALKPFLPETTEKILEALKAGKIKEIGALFPRVE